ncbi:hypothetical protein AVEN_81623-1 [Araneus ventricosus]|uniref:Uncharacterized protein n=1 Tax=Araneus ventricosus TaxID=182803 RepID=A0A4Y2HF14_ARAVE|nr:hypothetical protein AVEN_81623-1 [Araneus ventricosus]
METVQSPAKKPSKWIGTDGDCPVSQSTDPQTEDLNYRRVFCFVCLHYVFVFVCTMYFRCNAKSMDLQSGSPTNKLMMGSILRVSPVRLGTSLFRW